MDTDVIVIGAGLAGLSAADALAAQGHDVVVWEARDRVGGRTLSEQVEGVTIDLGAQWLGPTQHRMHELARRFDLATFPTWTTGRSVLVDGQQHRTYAGTVPLLGPVQLGRMGLALRSFTRMARTAGPVGGADLAGLDPTTLAQVLDGPLGDGAARRVVDTAIRVIFGAEPAELSAAWVAAYAAAAGGDLLELAAIDRGAQQTRLVGGTQAFSVALAAGLDVVLDRPVRRIARDTDGVTVTAWSGETIRARHAVCAVPTPLVDTIQHDPPLPHRRTALQQRMPMGATTKVFMFHDEPFWRSEGLRGEAVLTDGPVQVLFDNSAADGSAACLLAFVTGRAAHDAADRPEEELVQATIAAAERAFGPRAARPQQVRVKQWQLERWSAGCPVANLVPGAMAPSGDALRAPVGRLHWAGTETSGDWTGYMEGAVASGRRAATEILAGD